MGPTKRRGEAQEINHLAALRVLRDSMCKAKMLDELLRLTVDVVKNSSTREIDDRHPADPPHCRSHTRSLHSQRLTLTRRQAMQGQGKWPMPRKVWLWGHVKQWLALCRLLTCVVSALGTTHPSIMHTQAAW
jgi:hypothetical protein